MKYAFLLATALAAAPPNAAVAEFAQGRFEAFRDRFSAQMKAAVTVQRIRDMAAFGSCKVPAGPPSVSRPNPQMENYIYRLDCEKRAIGLSLTTDAAGVIHGLYFVEPPTGFAVITGEYQLPAKLTMPSGPGPFPAVVLVHGSGPHDMDETLGPNKPFRDIADGLAAKGIASLRYTKRTRQYRPATITLDEETIQDALSAAKLLRSTAKIDPKRIFVIGHSQGGYAAPRIGKADPTLAGLILLGANSRPIGVLVAEQTKYLGMAPEEAAQIMLMMPEAYRKELSEDPVPVAKALQMPMLILQGERDYQVTMADFQRWQTLRGQRVTLKSYPALNHLFQPGQGKSTPAEYQMAAPFSPMVIDDMAAWIKR
jgi:dienelactone hydrolase